MTYLTRSAILTLLLMAPAARAESTVAHGVTFDAHTGISSTTGGVFAGPLVGVGLGTRVKRVSGTAFADLVAGSSGRASSLGVGVGPSVEIGGHDFELLATVGRAHYRVGPVLGATSEADSTFVGARFGFSRAPVAGARVLYGLHAFYARDLSTTERTYSTGPVWSESSATKTATMGGHTLGIYLRLGGVVGF